MLYNPGDPLTSIVLEARAGVVGVDNVAVQLIEIPGWMYWGFNNDPGPTVGISDPGPTVEEGGPEGNYLHLAPGASASIKAELPEDVKSLIYWRRVSSLDTHSVVHVSVGNGEEGEQAAGSMLSSFIDDVTTPNTWVKRVVDVTGCPPQYPQDEFEGPCEEISVNIGNSGLEGSVDFAFSMSSDSDADKDGLYDDWEEPVSLLKARNQKMEIS